jgi:hypothetical protein
MDARLTWKKYLAADKRRQMLTKQLLMGIASFTKEMKDDGLPATY